MPCIGAEPPSWEPLCDSQSKGGRALVYTDLPDAKPAVQRGRVPGLKPQTGLLVALRPDGSCGHWFYTVSIRLLSNLAYAMTHSGKSILDQELSKWWRDGRGVKELRPREEGHGSENVGGCKIPQPRKTLPARAFPAAKIPPRSEKDGPHQIWVRDMFKNANWVNLVNAKC